MGGHQFASSCHLRLSSKHPDVTQNFNSVLHHREHGWKDARAGVPRAKTGIMRRVSMAILKANARHVLRGLEIVVPKAMHTHTARRARSEAARQADFDSKE